MPELPDVEVYLDALRRTLRGRVLRGLKLGNPFVLRTVSPRPNEAVGRTILAFSRIGKRIVFEFENDLFFVLHLMIAGRLRWRKPGAKLPGRRGLALFEFDHGSLLFTEEGRKKRASLHVVGDRDSLSQLDPGGIDVFTAPDSALVEQLMRENRTLKRALTDPHLFSGIGNAYSDEILHAAKLSPFKRTRQLSPDEAARLFESVRHVLQIWIDRHRESVGDGFPEKVTAFHDQMMVHGKYGQPCPVCGSPIQRVVYAEREANYCPGCQTEGRVLADRALSRLLKDDWPKTLDELEEKTARRSESPGRK